MFVCFILSAEYEVYLLAWVNFTLKKINFLLLFPLFLGGWGKIFFFFDFWELQGLEAGFDSSRVLGKNTRKIRKKNTQRVLRRTTNRENTAHTHLAAAKNDDGIKDKDAFSLFSHFLHFFFFFSSVVSRASQNEEARCSDDVSLSSFLLRARIFVLDW